MGQQIKKLEKSLETFPPPQSDKDLFVEKISISFYLFLSYYRHAVLKDTGVNAQEWFKKTHVSAQWTPFMSVHNNLSLASLAVTPFVISIPSSSNEKKPKNCIKSWPWRYSLYSSEQWMQLFYMQCWKRAFLNTLPSQFHWHRSWAAWEAGPAA